MVPPLDEVKELEENLDHTNDASLATDGSHSEQDVTPFLEKRKIGKETTKWRSSWCSPDIDYISKKLDAKVNQDPFLTEEKNDSNKQTYTRTISFDSIRSGNEYFRLVSLHQEIDKQGEN